MMLIFADRGIQSGWSADSIQSTLEGIEEKFEKCNDKLASVSVGPCSYQFQADKIEKMTQDLQTLQRYAGSQQIAWMLGAATGCIVSTAGMNLVFRNPKTGVVRECSLEEITSLEKLDASEIDIAKLGKEVPTDDLELYMRYQKEGSIEHFTDSEKKTISRIETMGIKGDECEEILRARGREFNRPPREEPEVVLPPRNESEGKGSSKADVLAQNRANGRAFEQQEFAKFSSQNNKAVEQITVKTPSGVRTRVDAIGLDVNGNVVINEYKSSLTAPLTNNQKAAFPEILERGATVVGKGKGIFTGGYQIPPGTGVKIIRPE